MRTIARFTVGLGLLLIVAGGCNGLGGPGKRMPMVFEADFENGGLDAWQPTDSAAWRTEGARGGKVLALHKQSD